MERTQVQYQVLRATVDMSVSQHPQTKRHGGSPEHSGKSSQRWYKPTLVLERTGQGANHQLQQHNQGFRVPCQELCPLLSPLQRQLRKWGLGRQCRCHRRSLRPVVNSAPHSNTLERPVLITKTLPMLRKTFQLHAVVSKPATGPSSLSQHFSLFTYYCAASFHSIYEGGKLKKQNTKHTKLRPAIR